MIRFSRRPPIKQPIRPSIHKDWSMSDGTTAIAANAFPAKYSFSTTTASCNDYIVYPTGSAPARNRGRLQECLCGHMQRYGSDGCLGVQHRRRVNALSCAFARWNSGRLYPGQCEHRIAGAPEAITDLGGHCSFTGSSHTAVSANYRTCTAPCYTTITLSGSPNDTNSSPFYVYGADLSM